MKIKAAVLDAMKRPPPGTTVTAGLPHPDQRLGVSPAHLVGEERTLKGSYIGSCVPLRDVPRYIALYRRARLPVDGPAAERPAQARGPQPRLRSPDRGPGRAPGRDVLSAEVP